jgi:hypothetical protein
LLIALFLSKSPPLAAAVPLFSPFRSRFLAADFPESDYHELKALAIDRLKQLMQWPHRHSYRGELESSSSRSARRFNSHSRAKLAALLQVGVWSSSGGRGAVVSMVAMRR